MPTIVNIYTHIALKLSGKIVVCTMYILTLIIRIIYSPDSTIISLCAHFNVHNIYYTGTYLA